MKQTVSFIVSALVLSSMAMASCFLQFQQRGPGDYYAGLDPRNMLGLYYDLGTRRSNCQFCDPVQEWTYAWKDGVALKGIFGGRSEWQCKGINCPRPWYNKGCRMVVALSSPTGAGTRYILDTVAWSYEEKAFEFDFSQGTIHTAGWLKPPSVTFDEASLHGPYAKVNVSIPVPRGGFYSDAGFDPRYLVKGIAILGTYSALAPATLKTKDFEVLATLSLDLASLGQDTSTTIETQVNALKGAAAGNGYYAYTLILNNPGNLLDSILLPYASPVTLARDSMEIIRSAVLEMGESDAGSQESSVTIRPRISDVMAVDGAGAIELKFSVSGDPAWYEVEVLRSTTLVEWATLNAGLLKAESFNSGRAFTLLDAEADVSTLEGDVWYEIRLVDRNTGELLDSLRTLAQIP